MSQTPTSSEKITNTDIGTPISPKIDTPPSTPLHSPRVPENTKTPDTEVVISSSHDPVLSCIYKTPPSSPLKDGMPVCSPTLAIAHSHGSSPNASTHSRDNSVLHPINLEPSIDHSSNFQPGPVSSTMSERHFDGDLTKERVTGSNILAAADEWVVDILTGMKGDGIRPPFSDLEAKSPYSPVVQSKPIFDQTPRTELTQVPI